MRMEVKGRLYDVEVSETGHGMFRVVVDGTAYDVRVPDDQGDQAERPSAHGPETGLAAEGHVLSPLPGVVVKILVREGEGVKTGQALIMLESMKMHVPVTAHKDGFIGRILVNRGESLRVGQKILELR